MAKIEIDADSGFCFGVVTAIRKAEEELDKTGQLYCLGDIVHNADEVERLRTKGLHTISHAELKQLRNVKVLLRAHGEPPETYRIARENGIEIIDATCPVVLRLQRSIKQAHDSRPRPRILIYGKRGHAEVNGLVGQTEGEAIVIQNMTELAQTDLNGDIALYSQTTKSVDGFEEIVSNIKKRKTDGNFRYFDTICRNVSNRMPKIRNFATSHQIIIFVGGKKSSNAKVLCEECISVNPRTHFITNETELQTDWFEGVESIGICGATSTPRWLMQKVHDRLEEMLKNIVPL